MVDNHGCVRLYNAFDIHNNTRCPAFHGHRLFSNAGRTHFKPGNSGRRPYQASNWLGRGSNRTQKAHNHCFEYDAFNVNRTLAVVPFQPDNCRRYIIFGLSYGTMVVMHPTIVANYFGPDVFAGINAAIAPFTIIFAACVPTLSGYIFEKTSSYDWPFIILLIVMTLALIASFFLLPPRKPLHLKKL